MQSTFNVCFLGILILLCWEPKSRTKLTTFQQKLRMSFWLTNRQKVKDDVSLKGMTFRTIAFGYFYTVNRIGVVLDSELRQNKCPNVTGRYFNN